MKREYFSRQNRVKHALRKFVNDLATIAHNRREQSGENRHEACEVEIGKGRHVPKCDSSTGFRLAMSKRGRPEQALDDGGVADAMPACVALVPVVHRTEWSADHHPLRPASTFIAQLFATAEQAQQARGTTVADAQTAYSASWHQARGAGIRTRHII